MQTRNEKYQQGVSEEELRREKCFAEIDDMNFGQRCQCYVDHKTARALEKSGFGLKPILKVRAEDKPSIQKIMRKPRYWIEFFLENKPEGFWDHFLIRREYEAWVRFHLCALPGKTDWHKWVYGGCRNPILDKKWTPSLAPELNPKFTFEHITDTPKSPLQVLVPQR